MALCSGALKATVVPLYFRRVYFQTFTLTVLLVQYWYWYWYCPCSEPMHVIIANMHGAHNPADGINKIIPDTIFDDFVRNSPKVPPPPTSHRPPPTSTVSYYFMATHYATFT